MNLESLKLKMEFGNEDYRAEILHHIIVRMINIICSYCWTGYQCFYVRDSLLHTCKYRYSYGRAVPRRDDSIDVKK